jgi:hypothetical protein
MHLTIFNVKTEALAEAGKAASEVRVPGPAQKAVVEVTTVGRMIRS